METKIDFFSLRLRHLFLFLFFCFLSLGFYLFYLQVVRGKHFYQISEENRREVYLQRAPRGLIFDRNGKIIADNGPVTVLFFSVKDLDDQTIEQTVKTLNKLFKDYEEEKIKQKIDLQNQNLLVRLKENVPRNEMLKLEENRTDLPGIDIQIELHRRYPHHNFASHLLGHLGEINKEELDRLFLEGYRRGDWIGKTGLEYTYDRFLRGEAGGIEIEVDARRRQRKIIRNFPWRIGKNLFLTIDQEVQKVCEEELRNKTGAIIVLNPSNGEVLALACSPEYDPNLFVEENNKEDMRLLLKDPQLPLFNRALQGRYAPGSIFKIITAICALEEKKVNLEEQFYCPGQFSLGEKIFHCWKPEGHGRITFLPALIHSCDVCFYQLGLRCGVDLLESYARKFGLEIPSQIDLPGENKGLIPGRVWKKRHTGESWYDGDTVNLAIGQGYMLVTPLAAANLAATLANRGKLYQPHLVKKIVDEEESTVWEAQPHEILSVNLDSKTWQILNEGLKEAVAQGTGRAASLPGINIAGKTGTAQNPQGKDHAWFIGFAPVENPKIAYAIFVEHGGRGGVAAAPLARKVILTALAIKEKEISVLNITDKESD